MNLKPSNIFVTDNHAFRIGDLGFMNLASLKYASLPETYRSRYTAPEITDAFSALNTTIDVYAAGLILYQAYNGGTLPPLDEEAPAAPLPAPLYADYEMAEIILKACALDPQERWEDPMQMGQALVSYMQRNGANDTPIVPAPIPVEETEENPEIAETADPEDEIAVEAAPEAAPETQDEAETAETSEECPDEAATEEASDKADTAVYEDDFGNLSFLDYVSAEEEYADETDIENIPVTQEVSDMLEQADALIAHPTPDPVVAPDPIDVPIPDPIPVEEAEEDFEAEGAEENTPADTEEASEETESTDDEADEETEEEDEEADVPKKKSSGKAFRNTLIALIVLIVLAAAACGVYYYQHYYLQPVQAIVLDGSETSLTVFVESKIDNGLLTVICADSHGYQLEAPVVDGKATFTNLVPNTAYTIRLAITGFHQLTGDISTAYSTPDETEIVQFNAVTGAENGSAILTFTLTGSDSEQWNVFYAAEGEEEKSVAFTGHMVTLSGLTVGKEYTLRLEPTENLYVTGIEEIKFTASNVIRAESLKVLECASQKLTAVWAVPGGVNVASWTVRCHNDKGYDKTLVVETNTVTFDSIDPANAYTVEVTAAGMSVYETVSITENSYTVRDFKATDVTTDEIELTWTCDRIPQGGWTLSYTANSSAIGSVTCSENAATISSATPGATYVFTLQDPNGATVLGGTYTCSTPAE